MDLLEGIHTRRSIRQFSNQHVKRNDIIEIIKAGIRAPSGLNNQPWRFVIARNKDKLIELSSLTKYGKIIKSSAACIAVFMDTNVMYHEIKDAQAIGACIENMLLAVHALDLGAVWLGEILKNADKVNSLFEVSQDFRLMAVVAIGYPAIYPAKLSPRKDISEVLLKEI